MSPLKKNIKRVGFYNKRFQDQLKNLKIFIPEIEELNLNDKNPDATIGWGYKNPAKKSIEKAKKFNIPFIAMEDGFIRSVGSSERNFPRLSAIVDSKSIYYKPDGNHGIDRILKKLKLSSSEKNRADELIKFINENKITKYNHGLDLEELELKIPSREKNILLIDQTFNDSSVTHASNGQKSFDEMFKTAKHNNHKANILIKTHPDVILGKKKGYLEKFFKEDKVIPISENVNIHDLFKISDSVYTVTSLSGMEALIAKKEVHCFGKPFYSNKGLTTDYSFKTIKKTSSKKHTLHELITASYIHYPRYINPYKRKLCEIEEFLEIIKYLKSKYSTKSKKYYGLGFTYWKQENVLDFLKTPNNEIKFFKNENEALEKAQKEKAEIVVWASKETKDLEKKCKNKRIKLNRMEDGFIRSAGLGSNLNPASSLVIDSIGIYYDPSSESDLEKIIKESKYNVNERKRANDLIKIIQNSSLTKYNLSNEVLKIDVPKNRKKILIPGQVENDASIKAMKTNINSNLKLLKEVRKNNPDAFIIFKPHPDVSSGNRYGKLSSYEIDKYANITIDNASVSEVINKIDEVHTISSLVGFEALVRGKKVSCYGLPFYAGWGLTKDYHENKTRRKKITLEELLYAALISYPNYIDPISNLPCEVEVIAERLSKNRDEVENIEYKNKNTKIIRKFKRIMHLLGLRY